MMKSIKLALHWAEIFEGEAREQLEIHLLPAYIRSCRWFGGKAREILRIKIADVVPVGENPSCTRISLLKIHYVEAPSDIYVLPIAFGDAGTEEWLLSKSPQAIIGQIWVKGDKGVLYDGMYDESFCHEILSMIAGDSEFSTQKGSLLAYSGGGFPNELKGRSASLQPQMLKAEQSNTSVLYENKLFLKIYRHPENGANPDLEMLRFLTEKTNFPHVPPFAGGIEYKGADAEESLVVGILQGFVPNAGDALSFYINILNSFYERILQQREDISHFPKPPGTLLGAAHEGIQPHFEDLTGRSHVEMTKLLGARTAELHLALASDQQDPDFKPEDFSFAWQQLLFASMQGLADKVLLLLRKNLPRLPHEALEDANRILELQSSIADRIKNLLRKGFSAKRIRVHGDYHLGQVLFTGDDFIIIDFEGEPARNLAERSQKKSPLIDVAGMIRSFHYAAYLALLKGTVLARRNATRLSPWAELWYRYTSAAFLGSYLDVLGKSNLIPGHHDELETMLEAFLLDKAIYELGYELNNRPDWVMIPARGITGLLGGGQGGN